MKIKKIIIIISSVLILIVSSGFLIFFGGNNNVFHRGAKDPTASASAVAAGSFQDSAKDYTYIPPTPEYDDNKTNNGEETMEDQPFVTPFVPATVIDLDPASITVFVNKEYALPGDYIPTDLEVPDVPFDISYYDDRKLLRQVAARALEDLFSGASQLGYTLYGVSGYRSYERQYKIFTNNIVTKGKAHTIKYSAVPGTSEHQTGLSIDVSIKSINYKLSAEFGKTDEGKWLEEHAHEYGYIIRYPKGKADITGYAYEPWHIRYVGKDLATYIYENSLTLDEYYHYTPSPDFNFDLKYTALINYQPPKKPTPTENPEETPDVGDAPEHTQSDDANPTKPPKSTTAPTKPPVKEDPGEELPTNDGTVTDDPSDTDGQDQPEDATQAPLPEDPTPTPQSGQNAGDTDPGVPTASPSITPESTPEITPPAL